MPGRRPARHSAGDLHIFFTPASYHALTASPERPARARSRQRRKSLSGKQSKQKRTGGTAQRSQTTTREEKRAQFEQPKSRTGLHMTLAAASRSWP